MEPSERLDAVWNAETEAMEGGDIDAAIDVVLAGWLAPDAPRELRDLVASLQRRAFELEAYGSPEIRDLSAVLVGLNHRMTIQPIIEHPKSLKIAPELMQYSTVKHVVFGIHDFSKAMGIQITPRN